jgi:hypothetical protein
MAHTPLLLDREWNQGTDRIDRLVYWLSELSLCRYNRGFVLDIVIVFDRQALTPNVSKIFLVRNFVLNFSTFVCLAALGTGASYAMIAYDVISVGVVLLH